MAKKKAKKKVEQAAVHEVTREDVHRALAESKWAIDTAVARISRQMNEFTTAVLDGRVRITPIAGKKKGTVK